MYEIKVLNSDEFDNMAKSDPRYDYVDDTNLGFADRAKGIAYVRQTHIHDLNKYLINHELEELEQDQSTHEDANGIRHKKGPKLFKDIILPFISGGAIQSQAPQREAAQTQFVEGVGNVPVSQLSQFSGSYSPNQGSGQGVTGAFGGYGSPLNLFSSSGSYSPANAPLPSSGSYNPTIYGQGLNDLPDYLRKQLSGSEAGRIVF